MKREMESILQEGLARWREKNPLDDAVSLSPAVEPAPAHVPGDLSSNLPMVAAKAVKRAPRSVAQEMIDSLPAQEMVDKVEIAGPGFLNFHLKTSWLYEELRLILQKQEAYARASDSGRPKILLEFVSANPNGPLHVGHGRGAALGDALARIYRHLGAEVSTEYYVNDGGNQMDNLGASVIWRCHELDPGFLEPDEESAWRSRAPEDLYKGDYIKDIARGVMAKFPDKPSRPKGLSFFREEGISYMLEVIRGDLRKFRVSHDRWFRESSLHQSNAVSEALSTLKGNGHLKEEDGALWFVSTKFGDDKDRVIQRADARPTYFAADIAYHDQKLKRGFDRLINIWGTDHHGYVARLKAVVQALGQDPGKLSILLYQLVSLSRAGSPVAMSTRTGEFVTLSQVVDEVGVDACRFFFALRSPNSHLEFDLELAKKQAPENPVFYVQYVHARGASIFREAKKRGIKTEELESFFRPAALEPAERSLLTALASYPDVLELCARDMTPHHLTAYLLALAGGYHRFYEKCQVLGEDAHVSSFRLALVEAVRVIIRNGLGLLGVSAPEEM